ncbi:50S ribosomal protein L13 [Candidatus Saccharibacteria bacterium]|nr:MAG: 50S ribosomal protein L13 [Candidatus Saccharibacteria bacterium]
MNKTYSAKPSDVTRNWWVVDAAEVPLGRLSTKIATLLTGKEKPQFTHHIDCGDFVVVINADKLIVTGNTAETDKMYYHHSGFPGGLTETSLAQQRVKDPTLIIEKAVRGMLPVNKLRPERLKRLKVYAGSEHTHAAQKPVAVRVGKEAK